MKMETIHIGLDDIDSPRGGCTTHFASILVSHLEENGVEWLDYPSLVRLNPNIPYRTRGNGAVALRFLIAEKKVGKILPLVTSMVEGYVERGYPNTNPGVVLLEGNVPKAILNLAQNALWRTIPIAHARRIAEMSQTKVFTLGNGRGLVGGLSAIGNLLEKDHTFEYIAYRPFELSSEPRGVDEISVHEMDSAMGGRVFANIDTETGRSLIAPHGPDPVLYGIRGEKPDDVVRAATFIRTEQEIERWTVFRSNQGTGAHLSYKVNILDLRPYMAALVEGTIDTSPLIIEGGHIVFGIENDSVHIDCAAYEPTGEFRTVVNQLIVGDRVIVHAAVRPRSRTHGLTLNVEGLEVVRLAEKFSVENPFCPRCLKRMKSAGKEKGYKCVNCGHIDRV
ncbi:MAG: DUF1743 domain-containing protein, partial [Candidatus Hodarchaeota archaeon]